jgi:deazaflavin-dependent oxidoreductase (nitroreductase family)
MSSTAATNYNQQVIDSFRANKGNMDNRQLLLLTTTGAKSGKTRLNPLAFSRAGDRYVVLASKGGAPTNPDWYYNLVRNPEVTVEVGDRQFQARAIVTQGEERDRLFNAHAAIMPGFAEYQEKTSRQIPVIILEPLHESKSAAG